MGNFNDQSEPKFGNNADPIRFADVCLRADFLGRDSEPVRAGHRVFHVSRGAGRVSYLGNIVEQRVFVDFDSGTSLFVPSGDLIHE